MWRRSLCCRSSSSKAHARGQFDPAPDELLRARTPLLTRACADADEHTGPFHLADCAVNVTVSHVHSAAAVFDEPHTETLDHPVERRGADTVIRGQAADDHTGDTVTTRPVSQPGRARARIVEKTAIAVQVRMGAVRKDPGNPAVSSPGGETGATGILDAVNRPERLGEALDRRGFERLPARVIRRKIDVVGGVPVLGCGDEVEPTDKMVGDRRDSVVSWTARAPRGRKSF